MSSQDGPPQRRGSVRSQAPAQIRTDADLECYPGGRPYLVYPRPIRDRFADLLESDPNFECWHLCSHKTRTSNLLGQDRLITLQLSEQGLCAGLTTYEVGNAVANPRITNPTGRIAYDEMGTTLRELVCGIINDEVSARLSFMHVVQNSRVAILATCDAADSGSQFFRQQCTDIVECLTEAPRAMYDQFASAFFDARPKVIGPAKSLVTCQN